ncbi:MAG: T9SS type A sorting domain-containing protein [Bacteroidales bacterium]|nr:T9SS type A sorting domain-containing protein [Bacteroidales bacterium]
MKRTLLFLLMVSCLAMQAQSVDYELLGFLDSRDSLVEELVLTASEDFTPSLRLKNNGPDMPAATDTVYFDIYYNGSYLTYFYLRGSQLQSLVSGQEGTVSLPQPLMTAAQMDEYVITACQICIEVRIAGSAHDPVADNNRACVQVNRPLPVPGYAEGDFRVGPNPAHDVLRVQAPAGTQVEFFDMSGRKLLIDTMIEDDLYFNVSDFPAGFYFVKMSNGKTETVRKIIIAK